MRTLVFLLCVTLGWLAAPSGAEARVGEHENRFRGGDVVVRGRWTELASVSARGRKVLVFAPRDLVWGNIALRATVDADGHVASAVLSGVRESGTSDCSLPYPVENFLTFAVPADDQDDILALIHGDARRLCADPQGLPITKLGLALLSSTHNGGMRLPHSDVSAHWIRRGRSAFLELTVTFRGTPVPDAAAAAMPPRPLTRPDGATMSATPSPEELAAARNRIAADLSTCASTSAPRAHAFVAIELDWTGHVTNVIMPAAWTGAPGADCLGAAFRKFEVPPFLRPTHTVRYPVTLR